MQESISKVMHYILVSAPSSEQFWLIFQTSQLPLSRRNLGTEHNATLQTAFVTSHSIYNRQFCCQ